MLASVDILHVKSDTTRLNRQKQVDSSRMSKEVYENTPIKSGSNNNNSKQSPQGNGESCSIQHVH